MTAPAIVGKHRHVKMRGSPANLERKMTHKYDQPNNIDRHEGIPSHLAVAQHLPSKSVSPVPQIPFLFLRRLSAQHFIPMRIPPKPLNNSLMPPLVTQQRLSELHRRLPLLPIHHLPCIIHQILAHPHTPPMQGPVLGVHEWKQKPATVRHALPHVLPPKHPLIDSARGNFLRERIEHREGYRGPLAAVGVARDLV